jgi:hypothetical protein
MQAIFIDSSTSLLRKAVKFGGRELKAQTTMSRVTGNLLELGAQQASDAADRAGVLHMACQGRLQPRVTMAGDDCIEDRFDG